MRNLLFEIAYKGTHYHGFQIQKNALTIEEVLKSSYKKLSGEDVAITGCGRTDAGVHAKQFFFNIKTNSPIPPENFPVAFNSFLPPDIGVSSCTEVHMDFHARFDAKGKTYAYKILNSNLRDPFLEEESFFYPPPLCLDSMKKASEAIVGTKDFRAFMAQGSKVKTTVRTIYNISVEKTGKLIEIQVSGNGFLYNMVRIIAGTLIDAGLHKITGEDIAKMLEIGDRKNMGMTVPPCGLCLMRVVY